MPVGCVGLFGYLWGHKMRPRYDTIAETPVWLQTIAERASGKFSMNHIPLEERSTYRYDVCVRCGIATDTDEGHR